VLSWHRDHRDRGRELTRHEWGTPGRDA